MRSQQRLACGLVLGLATLCGLSAAQSSDDVVCTNVLDDSFFNQCRIQNPPAFLTAVGNTITGWVAPSEMATVASLFVLLLPLPMLFGRRSGASLENTISELVPAWQKAHVFMLNFCRRVGYTLALNVALYAVFRQRRPCVCNSVPVGSIYGMPSGDAMSGGIVGMYFVLWNPFGFTWLNRFLGLAVLVLKCLERLVLGMHSMGQVMTGASLGIALSLYAEFTPQYMVVIDFLVQLLIGVIALPLDDNLRYSRDNSLNIIEWYLWGMAFNIFFTVLLMRHFYRQRWEGWNLSLRKAMALHDTRLGTSLADSDSDSVALGSSSAAGAAAHVYTHTDPLLYSSDSSKAATTQLLRHASDVRVTMAMFLFFTLGILVCYTFNAYAWGVEP